MDIDPATGSIDPDRISAAVTSRTKAVVPVHLYGSPVALGRVLAAASSHSLAVIEDACQAAGAQYDGRRCGSFGHAGCFSFYPTKNLGGYGDGGMVVTNDASLAADLRRRRFYGQISRDVYVGDGTNSRLDELQAAMLLVKLPHLDRWNGRRRALAARYLDSLPDWVTPYRENPRAISNYHLFVVNVDQRERLQRHLAEAGVQTRVHYHVPLYRLEPFRKLGYGIGDLPATDQRAATVLSLPIYPELSDAQLDRVVDAVATFRP